jgi:hypothetical protein
MSGAAGVCVRAWGAGASAARTAAPACARSSWPLAAGRRAASQFAGSAREGATCVDSARDSQGHAATTCGAAGLHLGRGVAIQAAPIARIQRQQQWLTTSSTAFGSAKVCRLVHVVLLTGIHWLANTRTPTTSHKSPFSANVLLPEPPCAPCDTPSSRCAPVRFFPLLRSVCLFLLPWLAMMNAFAGNLQLRLRSMAIPHAAFLLSQTTTAMATATTLLSPNVHLICHRRVLNELPASVEFRTLVLFPACNADWPLILTLPIQSIPYSNLTCHACVLYSFRTNICAHSRLRQKGSGKAEEGVFGEAPKVPLAKASSQDSERRSQGQAQAQAAPFAPLDDGRSFVDILHGEGRGARGDAVHGRHAGHGEARRPRVLCSGVRQAPSCSLSHARLLTFAHSSGDPRQSDLAWPPSPVLNHAPPQ